GWIAGFAVAAFIINLALTAFRGKEIPQEGFPAWIRRSLAMERYGMRQEGYPEESLPLVPHPKRQTQAETTAVKNRR
ncbi:hypothetical protein B9Q04_17395, partial [Candidatus Marsarchaeota G2 archaeon BE_D]